MVINIELPDLEEIYHSYYDDDDGLTGRDIKAILVNMAVEKFVRQIYEDYTFVVPVSEEIHKLIKEKSQEIIDRVVDKVAEDIVKKKTIVSEMPKKSEITNINKEWENYFVELIDKAIAKRFK